ncbi:hypothetical protein RxyAA322_03410 [Rubrobacter xylanophilus]|uniref:Uncharacterized protein n=1 Tax=Rubrobacter xylanophilus TaxID=49319 RepID=A0A510HJH5_9ACTN|nr:hypothetical protein [Rubrobacter xylanophilus]BBL78487.1 hypothetical protein RxyAA322_03410 [Rubrobacter xylanophilus]
MRSGDVLDLLAAPGPFSGYAERAMLYGPSSWAPGTWRRLGTTLRCYDPEDDTWHIAGMQPASGEFVDPEPVGDDIVQEVLFPAADGHCER